MFNFLKRKKVKHLTINCSTDAITINDQYISFPTNYEKLKSILGEPSREIQKSNTYVMWDDFGIVYSSNNLNKVLSINIYQYKKDKSEYNTKKQFSGSLILNDETITNAEFGTIVIGKNVIHRLGSQHENRFGFSIGANMHYVE